MVRKTTSIRMDIELWKFAKKKCIDMNLDLSDYLEELIKKDIKKSKK